MSQIRLRNYKHDILSFDHNIFNLGMHSKGRYSGFDEMVVLGNVLQCNIAHSADALSYKDPVNTTHGPLGIALTPQGDIIMEDDVIGIFTIVTNSGNSKTRYDLLVMNHNHTVVAGGQDATYTVIQGALEDPTIPSVVDPLKQTVLGIWELPPGEQDLNNCFYTKLRCPDSGDGADARLAEVNVFTKTQVQAKSAASLTNYYQTVTDTGVDARLWRLQNDGNVYEILPVTAKNFDGIQIKGVDLQDGARIYLHANENVTFRNTEYFVPIVGAEGWKPLAIPQGLGNIAADAGFGALGVKPAVGEIWEMEFVLMGGKWYLARIGGAGSASQFRVGMQIMWRGDTAANFETSGLGKNLMAGWRMCNGLGGTDDARGKLIAISDTIPGVGATDITVGNVTENLYTRGDVGTTSGETDFLIGQTNLPAYNLTVNDPGHQHAFRYSRDEGGSSFSSTWMKYDADTYSKNTATAYTGISVNLNGGGNRLTHLPPTYFTALIQKI